MNYFNTKFLVDAVTGARNPRKGDTVRTVVEGEYSHRGDPAIVTGFHIVKVDGWDVSLPPGTQFEVVKRFQLPEPPMNSIVHNTRTGNFWQRDGRDLLGRYWSCISHRGIERLGWQELLSVTDNGRALLFYHPAEAA